MEQFWNEWGTVIIGVVVYFIIIGLFMAFGKFLKEVDNDISTFIREKNNENNPNNTK